MCSIANICQAQPRTACCFHHSFPSLIMSMSCYKSQTTLHCISIRVDGNTTICPTVTDLTMSPLIGEVCKTKQSPVGRGTKQETRVDEWVVKWACFFFHGTIIGVQKTHVLQLESSSQGSARVSQQIKPNKNKHTACFKNMSEPQQHSRCQNKREQQASLFA